MSQLDTRIRILNSFLTTPHGQISRLAPLHTDALTNEADFYGHLAAWYFDHGEVRDHRTLFVAHLLTASDANLREAGWVLLQTLPPHQVAAALDHAKISIKKLPRIFKNAIVTYLQDMESNPVRFDRSVLRSRKAMKHLFASLRIKPSPRVQQILFLEDPPEASPLFHLKILARMQDPEEQAIAIIVHRIPYTTAVGALKQITPSILVALIDVMSPQEVINHLNALQRHGAFDNDEVRAILAEKLGEAATDTRVSTLKAVKAVERVQVDSEFREILTTVSDTRVRQIARIKGSTALFVDKSGSMERAMDVAKDIAAMVSAICDDFHVLLFDEKAHSVKSDGTGRSDWEKAFKPYRANGGTSMGAPLSRLKKDGIAVDTIIIVTDGGENAAPHFGTVYPQYVEAMGAMPNVVIVAVDGDCAGFELRVRNAGAPVTTWQFRGDYYSLPNLLPMLALPNRAELVEQIMQTPLPRRRERMKVS